MKGQQEGKEVANEDKMKEIEEIEQKEQKGQKEQKEETEMKSIENKIVPNAIEKVMIK